MEAEDQLLYDLQILTQLRLDIDSYTSQVGEQKVPRWERVRRFFRTVYSSWKAHPRFHLRPAFVFVAHSPDTVAALLSFFSSAASLASAQGGKVIVVGGAELAAAHDADANLGHPILRQSFDKHVLDPPGPAAGIRAFIDSKREILAPEVVAVLEAIPQPAQ
jgi:hypothetical protein